jgi:hypothetical protein
MGISAYPSDFAAARREQVLHTVGQAHCPQQRKRPDLSAWNCFAHPSSGRQQGSTPGNDIIDENHVLQAQRGWLQSKQIVVPPWAAGPSLT